MPSDPDIRPDIGANGVGACTESCPSHDGKRCEILGVRAPDGHVCEPWAARLAAKVAHMRSIAQGARAAAYVLAYSYTHDVRPPQRVVDEALAWRDDARAGGRTAALRGEAPAADQPAATLTRADVEAALARADRRRVDDAINYVLRTSGSSPVVDLVCAVLGVPDAG